MAKVLVIGDSQSPFEHPDYLRFLKHTYTRYGCDKVVHIGDEIDAHSLSNYDCDPDGYSPGHELKAAIEHLEPYYRAFPKVMVCESNHSMRIFAKASRCGIPKIVLKDFKKIINAPNGWNWQSKWIIDGVVYKHGLGYSGPMGAINAAKDELKSCVIGHLHSDAGILYWSNGKETIFGFNVGCGIDTKAYAFKYGRDHRKKPVLSCGVVLNGVPHLVAMNEKLCVG